MNRNIKIVLAATPLVCLFWGATVAWAAGEPAQSRWEVADSGRVIEWRVASDSRLPHRDWLEMSGRKVSLLFDYTVSSNRTLAQWPGCWPLPNPNMCRHPIESEAVNATDNAMNENSFASQDWGCPGKIIQPLMFGTTN